MSPVFRHGRLRLYLLKLLDEAPRHGYEVIRLLQDRFMGIYAPSPGTIYPRLARLEEEGLVTHDEADGRKVYRITEKGREELRARLDDLAELEDEITASVRDIAREVTEDVRETVRTLREELSWAAREFHARAHQPAGGADPGGDARHASTNEARARAESARAREAAVREAEAREQTGRAEQAAQTRDEAARAREDTAQAGNDTAQAREHTARASEDTAQSGDTPQAREDTAQAREDTARSREDTARSREDTAQAREDERRDRDHARRDRDHARRDRDHARRERHREHPDHGEREWGEWAGWTGWGGWPGAAGQHGWADPEAYRDLERLAKQFSRELRSAAWHAQAVSEDALHDLRGILDETIDRIKSEVFKGKTPPPGDPEAGTPPAG
jgi:DNA-binding PadR family transcriptional regulator